MIFLVNMAFWCRDTHHSAFLCFQAVILFKDHCRIDINSCFSDWTWNKMKKEFVEFLKEWEPTIWCTLFIKKHSVLRHKNNFFEIHIQPQFSLKGEVRSFVSNHFVKKKKTDVYIMCFINKCNFHPNDHDLLVRIKNICSSKHPTSSRNCLQ